MTRKDVRTHVVKIRLICLYFTSYYLVYEDKWLVNNFSHIYNFFSILLLTKKVTISAALPLEAARPAQRNCPARCCRL